MAIVGQLLKRGVKFGTQLENRLETRKEKGVYFPGYSQLETLNKLLFKARETDFGRYYRFQSILSGRPYLNRQTYEDFCNQVPVHDYNKMFSEWWWQCVHGESNVTWPGKVNYFALSSGTSDASSKYIPVTESMFKAMKKVAFRQMISLGKHNLPGTIFEKRMLMLGGCTELSHDNDGAFFYGDLSGITASRMPFWLQSFYKPGDSIARVKSWEEKLNLITRNAHKWDVGFIVGVPAWLQLLMEKIIAHYKVQSIHEVWPNLAVFVHGGVAITPYITSLNRIFSKPVTYMETYLASEGYIAYQVNPELKAMRCILDNGIFLEFIPFNSNNFNDAGELKPDPETLMVHEVEENQEYALLLSTCAGAWRYLIGDVVKFVNKSTADLVITGRTKHFLSLCGEHLSVDNMNSAIKQIADEFKLEIQEFTVTGVTLSSGFSHHWYIGASDAVDAAKIRDALDYHLTQLNDDYAVERNSMLRNVRVSILHTGSFYEWMRREGKEGGQHKFPRVLKGKSLESWKAFIASQPVISKA